MSNRSRLVVLVTIAVVLAACGGGGGGGTSLASVGPVGIPTPEKDKVTVTHIAPAPDRLSIVGLVENGSDSEKKYLVMAANVLDATGVKVGQGRGQVLVPITIPKGGVGLVRVAFDIPLPDPFTLEWEERDGDPIEDDVDLKVTSIDLQSSGRLEAVVENTTSSRVKVLGVVALCLDAAGNTQDLVLLPGTENKVPKGENARLGGPALPGCTSAIAGAVGTTNLDPPTTTTAPSG